MRTCTTAFIVALCTHATASAADLHLLGAVPYAYATDVSDDGQRVSGYDPGMVWWWNETDGVQQVFYGVPPGNGVGGMPRITGDGTRVGTNMLVDLNDLMKTEAVIIDPVSFDTTYCGSYGFNCDAERSGLWDMTRSGSTVVGLAWEVGCAARAYAWDQASGMVNLGTSYFYKPTRANGVSQDGRTIAGWNDDYTGFRQGCMFTKDTSGVWTRTLLTNGAGVKLMEAGCTSGDGVYVFGRGRTSLDNGAPYRYSLAGGYQSLGTPSPGTAGSITATNHDGSRAIGFFGMGGGFGVGFMWSQETGWRALNDVATAAGLDLANDYLGTSLSLPLEWTPDESTIVGTASGSYGTSPFVLHLDSAPPPSCPADIDANGAVDGADLGVLLSAWGDCAGGACAPDLDGNGAVDGADLGVMLSAWGACP